MFGRSIFSDDEIENLEWLEYDLTDTSSDDNEFDGGVFTDSKGTCIYHNF